MKLLKCENSKLCDFFWATIAAVSFYLMLGLGYHQLGTTIIYFFQDVAAFLNTSFGIAAAGSFFGAAGGYVMVWYTNRRAEILSTIRHTKTALAMSHSIFNVFLSLKKQHIKSMCADYKKNQADFIQASNAANQPIEIRTPLDYRSISVPYMDLNLITSEFFEKTELTMRGRCLALTLIRAVQELRNQIEYRDFVFKQMDEIAQRNNLNEMGKAHLYYGVEVQGLRNTLNYQSYNDAMDAIASTTDDCIWFAKELSDELIQTEKSFRRKVFIGKPVQSSIDYSDIGPDLIPEDESYMDWREKFSKAGNSRP